MAVSFTFQESGFDMEKNLKVLEESFFANQEIDCLQSFCHSWNLLINEKCEPRCHDCFLIREQKRKLDLIEQRKADAEAERLDLEWQKRAFTPLELAWLREFVMADYEFDLEIEK